MPRPRGTSGRKLVGEYQRPTPEAPGYQLVGCCKCGAGLRATPEGDGFRVKPHRRKPLYPGQTTGPCTGWETLSHYPLILNPKEQSNG